jgi:hypothetical protein
MKINVSEPSLSAVVDLLPIAVGHLKMVPLYADDETVRKVRDGEPLGMRGAERVPFRVSTGEGAGLTVQQPERQDDGQSANK